MITEERTFIPLMKCETAAGLAAVCPKLGQDVAVEVCAGCPFARGLHLGRDGGSFVACTFREADLAEIPPVEAKALRPSAVLVTEIMTDAVVTVTPQVRLDVLARIFLDAGISGAPVTDENGKPVGMVSKTDLLQASTAPPGEAEAEVHSLRTAEGVELEFGPGFRPEHLTARTVGDVMMPLTFAIPDTATVSQAAALMAHEGIHRVVVTSSDDRVVGLVSTIDVLRWMAKADGYVMPKRTRIQAEKGEGP